MKNYTKLFLRIGLILSLLPGLLTILCYLEISGEGRMACGIPMILLIPTFYFAPVHEFFEKIVSIFYSDRDGYYFAISLAGIIISLFIYALPMYLIGKYIDLRNSSLKNRLPVLILFTVFGIIMISLLAFFNN